MINTACNHFIFPPYESKIIFSKSSCLIDFKAVNFLKQLLLLTHLVSSLELLRAYLLPLIRHNSYKIKKAIGRQFFPWHIRINKNDTYIQQKNILLLISNHPFSIKKGEHEMPSSLRTFTCGLEMNSLLDFCYEVAKNGHTYPVSSDCSKNRTVNVNKFHPKSAL